MHSVRVKPLQRKADSVSRPGISHPEICARIVVKMMNPEELPPPSDAHFRPIPGERVRLGLLIGQLREVSRNTLVVPTRNRERPQPRGRDLFLIRCERDSSGTPPNVPGGSDTRGQDT